TLSRLNVKIELVAVPLFTTVKSGGKSLKVTLVSVPGGVQAAERLTDTAEICEVTLTVLPVIPVNVTLNVATPQLSRKFACHWHVSGWLFTSVMNDVSHSA